MANSTIKGNVYMELTLSVNETIPANWAVSKDMGPYPSGGYKPSNIYYVRNGGGNIFSLTTHVYNSRVVATIGNNTTTAVDFVGTIYVTMRKT